MIAKDMAITTKLLQVINSAYFGLPRTVTNPEEALSLLGLSIEEAGAEQIEAEQAEEADAETEAGPRLAEPTRRLA